MSNEALRNLLRITPQGAEIRTHQGEFAPQRGIVPDQEAETEGGTSIADVVRTIESAANKLGLHFSLRQTRDSV